MNRQEYFQFMRETANIAVDMTTGFAHVPVQNFGRDEKGAIESIELENLVNATIKLCMETALNVVRTVEPDYLLEELQNSLQALKVN